MSFLTKVGSRQSTIYALLILVLAAGLALRTWNINFDRGIGSHPDERSTACFYAPGIRLPASWAEFKDPKQSPMNPLWDVVRQERRGFTYGHFPLYLGVAMGELLHRAAPLVARLGAGEETAALLARADGACDGVAVAGRLVMALLDTLTILLLFFLGRRLYSPLTGLLAAAFYAFAAQAIQLSHFFAMDPASTTFTVLAVLGGVMFAQDRSIRAAIWTGLGAGLAISSKFSALPVLAVPAVASLLVFWDVAQARAREGHEPEHGSRHEFRALMGVPIAFGVALVTFALTSPYAVLDWQSFISATLVEQGRMVRGVVDFPFTRQYRNTWPYTYFIGQQLRWGLGWALGLAAAVGTLVALVNLCRSLYAIFVSVVGGWVAHARWRFVPQDRQAELIVWAWLIPYFGLTGAFLAKFNRYMLPVLPFVLLFAAGLIWRLWHLQWKTAPGESDVGRADSGEDDPEVAPQVGDSSVSTEDEPAPPATDATSDEAQHGPRAPLPAARILAFVLALVVLTGGLFWSLAYVNGVYNREHTWISASRWLYENAPPESVILWELWDDPLPKTIPGEPGMDMGSTGLRNIDWGPYEEDTAEKYAAMRAKLKEADYVAYSSKRIYDSVDELPERYPMTLRYYQSMWDGSLGFEVALDQTSPPTLLGRTFDDRGADESWSLYDHPQVTVFRKVRQLSDEEYDALFDGVWAEAIPWYRGADSPLSPLLALLGLGNSPESQDAGLLNRAIGLFAGGENEAFFDSAPEARVSLDLPTPLSEQPAMASYRWNRLASENTVVAIVWWWAVVALLGWLAWPYAFGLFRPLRDRGYLLSRGVGWLLSGWALWWLASLGWMQNSAGNAWIMVLLLGIGGGLLAYRQRADMIRFVRQKWGLIVVSEALFAAAFLFFVFVRLANPDLWQPWFGGEKFMEFAFLNGILRSPTFPPLDPHFANGYINYYYFGIYLVAYLIKLTGIYAEVGFNLAIPTLFGLTVVNAFSIAYSAVRLPRVEKPAVDEVSEPLTISAAEEPNPGVQEPLAADPAPAMTADGSRHDLQAPDAVEAPGAVAVEDHAGLALQPDRLADEAPDETIPVAAAPDETMPDEMTPADTAWHYGIFAALLAPLFVVLIGNLDGFAQVVRLYAARGSANFASVVPVVGTAVRALSGVVGTSGRPTYDFWGPSRVVPYTINEFPFWSFLFADLHPHLIGIPFSLLFLATILTLMLDPVVDWLRSWRRGVLLLAFLSLLLGTLASVNLWELPTYLGLGLLGFIVCQFYRQGSVRWMLTAAAAALYLVGAYLAFWPFFDHYVNVGAGGVGMVRAGDAPGPWLLIWGFFLFIIVTWLFFAASRPARGRRTVGGERIQPSGIERALSLGFRQFDRLPRVVYLHGRLVRQPTLTYQAGLWLLPVTIVASVGALWWGRSVLALCLPLIGLATLLLWRRGRDVDAGSVFVALLTATGLAILAGTQLIYLKDFLQGSDWYRMNTLFKFFSQVWVIWGVAAAVALPRIWHGFVMGAPKTSHSQNKTRNHVWRGVWATLLVLLFAASLSYTMLGTPARLGQRFVGWRPAFGTLNGLDFMREGVYSWPDESNKIELRYDWEAIQWLLDNVTGSPVIVESAEVDYYRAAGSRVASLTGLSGLRGMHASEQRYGDVVGERDGLHREFWETPDVARTTALIDELGIGLIYVGQLEQRQHPAGVQKIEAMAEAAMLAPIYANDRVTIYAVPDALTEREEGGYQPS